MCTCFILDPTCRGYYIRAKAINCVVTTFIEHHPLGKTQVLSLGAGFDTTFFRLHNEGKLPSCRYFEVCTHALMTTTRIYCVLVSVFGISSMLVQGSI